MQKARQHFSETVKTFVKLETPKVQEIFFPFQKSIINRTVPFASFQIKRRWNHTYLPKPNFFGQLLLKRTPGRMHVLAQPELRRFQKLDHSHIELTFGSRCLI